MAKLLVEVGGVVARVELDDENAAAMMTDFVAAYGGPSDKPMRRRLRWLVKHLGEHMEQVAGQYAEQMAAAQERNRVREARQAMRFAEIDEKEEQEAGQ
jgi:hypothetical protein